MILSVIPGNLQKKPLKSMKKWPFPQKMATFIVGASGITAFFEKSALIKGLLAVKSSIYLDLCNFQTSKFPVCCSVFCYLSNFLNMFFFLLYIPLILCCFVIMTQFCNAIIRSCTFDISNVYKV